jgi:ABC-2 type transport system permease protein
MRGAFRPRTWNEAPLSLRVRFTGVKKLLLFNRLKDSVPAYVFLARNAFVTAVSFRLRTLLFLFSAVIQILVQVFLWRALFASGGAQDGITLRDMISYLILSSLLRPLYGMRVGERLATGIYDGSIASDLLKPLHLKLIYTAHETGGILADLLLRALPTAVAWSMILGVPGPSSPASLAAALVALMFGILLNYRVEMIIGQSAFWLQDIWYLHWFHRALLSLFSGTLIPLWFYPGALRGLAEALPFRFTAFVPLSLYLGKTPVTSMPELVLYALIWLVVLGMLERLVWARGIRQIVIHGG